MKPASPDEQGLIRLIFASTAVRVLAPAELDAIEATSARHNRTHGLTGFLLFGGQRFYGVLEGPRRRVIGRMERIAVDPLHRRIVIVSEDDITERRFATWTFSRIDEGAGEAGGPNLLDSFILNMARRL